MDWIDQLDGIPGADDERIKWLRVIVVIREYKYLGFGTVEVSANHATGEESWSGTSKRQEFIC